MTAVTDVAFARSMAQLGPFEPGPDLAVAVSGGGDSMALVLLADRWARAHGGRVTALTVDHGLRRESADEARQVARWLAAVGIRHQTLRWSPAKARKQTIVGARMANLQAAARGARYDLLGDWCRRHGVLHLLLAHHRDDQAETLLLRLARGSGIDGLAAMAPLAERARVRLLRPLLSFTKTQLTGFLEARGQPWIEDPSNRDGANARVRVRELLPRLAQEGMTVARLADTAERLAQARAALDAATVRLLAQAVALYPEGYLRLDTALLRCAEREVGLRALARAITCIGGAAYGPRLERLTRLYEQLCQAPSGPGEPALGRGRTLGGCRIVPVAGRAKGDGASLVVIVREPAAVSPPMPMPACAGQPVLWDGRFAVSYDTGDRRLSSAQRQAALGSGRSLTIGALGEAGWRDVQQAGVNRPNGLPRDVVIALPALWRRGLLMAVPHLGYRHVVPNMKAVHGVAAWQVHFAPLSSLTRPGFTLV